MRAYAVQIFLLMNLLSIYLDLIKHFLSLSLDCTSTEKGDCCVFPFKYKGAVYDSCTFADSSKPWCALTSDYDKDTKFGYCTFESKFVLILL